MSIDILEKYFNIKPDQSVRIGRQTRYISNGLMYTIVPVTQVEQEVLIELYEMSEHMAKLSDKKVSRFVAGRDDKFLASHDNNDYVLLQNELRTSSGKKRTGRQLARFHTRGKSLQTQIIALNRAGEWKTFWGTRLDQMEKVWSKLIHEPPREEFDKLFIESFPYYLGLCENAIQYVTDAELDEQLQHSDYGTICHQRFSDDLWRGEQEIRNPFDWVLDHPSRDISEWVRDRYFKSGRTLKPDLKNFVNEYQSIAPLSPFAWRLIYARLLFPLHYFVCVEEYYNSGSQSTKKQLEETMARYLRDTKDYELFLRSFYEMAGVSTQSLPTVSWL